MSFSLTVHQIHNGIRNRIRNNRAEIASGCGNGFPLLETKNRCATSAKVIKAIEQPTEDHVLKAFVSQINKIHQLDVNDKRIKKYEKRLSNIYSSYLKNSFPETQNINSPVIFSISPESHTLKIHFNNGMSPDINEKIKDKINRDVLSAKADKPNNRIKLRFDF